jgi:hypothetical protein
VARRRLGDGPPVARRRVGDGLRTRVGGPVGMSDGQQQTVVERPDVPVMFVAAEAHQPSIPRGGTEPEETVGSHRGRRFYGVFDPVQREYRACVERRADDDPEALGLELGTLPGGRMCASVFTESRRRSTDSLHQPSGASRNDLTAITNVRASSSTAATTLSSSCSPCSEQSPQGHDRNTSLPCTSDGQYRRHVHCSDGREPALSSLSRDRCIGPRIQESCR